MEYEEDYLCSEDEEHSIYSDYSDYQEDFCPTISKKNLSKTYAKFTTLTTPQNKSLHTFALYTQIPVKHFSRAYVIQNK